MGIQRFDTAQINKFEFDSENGFLNIRNVPIACAGVFTYRMADGTTKREAKLPTELLSPSTVESANGKPITDNHPPTMLGKDTVRSYMKGLTATNAHVDKDMLKVDLTIFDEELINEISNGKEELSIGFTTELEPVTGSYNGETYDSVQSNIHINHVAVVDRGRAGHKVRLSGDSAEMIIDSDLNTKENGTLDVTEVRLNGETIRIDTKDVEKVVKADSKLTKIDELKNKIAKLQKELEEAEASEKDLSNKANESEKEVKEKADKLDALEKEYADYKKQYSADALDEIVNNRVELQKQASTYLGDAYDYKGKTEREIKVDSIKTVNKDFDDTDVSDEKISGAFDALNWTANNKTHTVGWNGNKADDKREDSAENSITAIYDKFNK